MARKSSRKRKEKAASAPVQAAPWDWKIIGQCALIFGLGFWVFFPALHGGWIGDDTLYLTQNTLLSDPHRLWKAWFEPGSFIEYYPLQETLQFMEWKLFGTDTLGYHLVNTVLHLIGALLVWRLLARFGLKLAWLGGLIFAVHPMVVDSVTLINEFKNTLSLPPFLLALVAWVDFEERRARKDYYLALGWFLVAMLCKITMAPFPAIILLYAWWKRGRIGPGDLEASLPFWAISAVLGWLTVHSAVVYGANNPTPPPEDVLSPIGRIILTASSLTFYFSRVFLPLDPLSVYPRWPVAPPPLGLVLAFVVFAGGVGAVWSKRRSWGRHAVLGLGFFIAMLAPFLGLNWVSYLEYTWVMDHFLYLPIIGPLGLVVAALGQLHGQLSRPVWLGGGVLVGGAIMALAIESHAYAGMYRDEKTMEEYTLRIFPGAWLARYNLAVDLMNEGKANEAIDLATEALTDETKIRGAHLLLGNAYRSLGEIEKAREEFELEVKLEPKMAEGHGNLGNVLLQTGNVPEAIAQYQEAIRLKPSYAPAHYNLANTLLGSGRPDAAIDEYREALRLEPENVEAHLNLGMALNQLGKSGEAVAELKECLELKPDDLEAMVNLGLVLNGAGQVPEALAYYGEALKIEPHNAVIYYNRGNALFGAGRVEEAMEDFRQASELRPDYAESWNNLGVTLLKLGRTAEARAEFQQALKIKPNFTDAQDNLAQCH